MAKKKAPAKKKKPSPKPKAARKNAAKKPKKAAAKRAPAKAKAKSKPKAKSKAKPIPPAPLPWRTPIAGESLVGIVDDFFGHISVIAFKLQGDLRVGDQIHVRGHTTDMVEPVSSMQMDHQSLTVGVAGDSIGIKTLGKCRAGDYVYRVG